MNSHPILISVIVPVYNVEKYLRQCLDSIIDQTYPHLEIILINDGSTDSSGDICDEYAALDSRIRVLHTPNGKQSSARNRGLEIAKGDYITFVDSDDWLELDTYTKCIEILQSKIGLDILMYGYYRDLDGISYKQPILGAENMSNQEAIIALMNRADFPPGIPFKLFKREVILPIRFYEGRVYEDVSFPLEVHLNATSFYYYPQPLYHYRANEESTSFVMKENIIDLYLNLEDLLYRIKDEHPEWVPIINATRIRWLQAHYPEIKTRNLRPERFKRIFRDMRRFPFAYTNWKNFLSRWSFIHFPEIYYKIKKWKS